MQLYLTYQAATYRLPLTKNIGDCFFQVSEIKHEFEFSIFLPMDTFLIIYLFEQRVEREIAQKLEEKEDVALELQETFQSLQQEVEVKTKKLKKLFYKLQVCKQEISDLQEEHINERQELEQTLNELTREVKLR